MAGAPKNNRGILGVWPGMREVNVSLPNQIACANSVAGIARAIQAGAAVINMSYGATTPCFAEYVQLQVATAKGITLVAAAGNELAEGNPLLFPASLPHVITVAAVGNDLKAAYFSSASAAVDLVGAGRRHPHRDAAAVRRGRQPRRLRGGHRHQLLRADGRRRGGVGARRQARLHAPTRSPRSCATPPPTCSAQGLGLRHRLRDAQPAARAQRARAGARPARAQRRHGVGQRQGDRPRRQPDLARRRPPPGARAGRQVRGPGRRLPDRLPSARARARDLEAALRQPGPRGLHPQRDLHGATTSR